MNSNKDIFKRNLDKLYALYLFDLKSDSITFDGDFEMDGIIYKNVTYHPETDIQDSWVEFNEKE